MNTQIQTSIIDTSFRGFGREVALQFAQQYGAVTCARTALEGDQLASFERVFEKAKADFAARRAHAREVRAMEIEYGYEWQKMEANRFYGLKVQADWQWFNARLNKAFSCIFSPY